MLYYNVDIKMRLLSILSLTCMTCLPQLATAKPPKVATDIAPVHSLVAQVMQGVGTPDLVISPGASPHGYSLRLSEAAALDAADIVVWMGPALTPWLEKSVNTLGEGAVHLMLMEAQGTHHLAMRNTAVFKDAHDHGHEDHDDEDDHEEHEDHDDHKDHDDHDDHADHDEHDDHKDHDDHEDHEDHDDHADEGHSNDDPHAWLDPDNAAVWIALIADELSKIDPDNAATYAENAKTALASLAQTTAEIESDLTPLRGKPFLVFHDAFQYFETRFGLTAFGALTNGDAAPTSPRRIAELQTAVADAGITCAVSEVQSNSELMTSLLEGTNTNILEIDPLGAHLQIGPQLYQQLLVDMSQGFIDCFSDT